MSVCPTTFRSDVPIEPSEEIPLHQADGTRVAHFGFKFLSMGVRTQKIEGRFDVRNVTKPIVAVGQVTERGQGEWLNGDGGFILDVKSARKIEKLLGDKRGFVELRKQKGVYVIPCEEQSSNLFPQVGQEPKQGTQMDRGEAGVEEERQARVKSAPVLPTEKEEEEHEVTHATFRSWCEACVAGCATEERPHGAVGACQVLRKGPEPHAMGCVLAYLDTWGLRSVAQGRQ